MAAGTIDVTPGSGEQIAFDKSLTLPGAVNGDAQIVKVAAGGDGDFVGYAGGRSVDGTSDEAAVYTENRADCDEYVATLTIETSAYVAGDLFGELQTITGAAKATGGGVRIDGITIIDNDAESAEFDILFFRDSITAGTDGSPFDPSDADLIKFRGGISVVASDWGVFTDNAVCSLIDVGLTIPSLVGTSLYFCLVIRTGDTFTAAGDVTIAIAYTRL